VALEDQVVLEVVEQVQMETFRMEWCFMEQNLGGGGGGGSTQDGGTYGAGGSGVVILKYQHQVILGTTTGSPTLDSGVSEHY
jgi:hypothetical protein